jgi:hypothetical protein
VLTAGIGVLLAAAALAGATSAAAATPKPMGRRPRSARTLAATTGARAPCAQFGDMASLVPENDNARVVAGNVARCLNHG